ncbi:hypothetical protein NDU88_001689 [Pleurodeles waltl]|uniref:Uncharacterized protein n=1 Tax=Pleurodeles waltl TaxID=8319 RepID=A0AAV7RDR0_PLEWA|nr:hypothetical protein NDU88_001689 [Pleurodeles waltl]
MTHTHQSITIQPQTQFRQSKGTPANFSGEEVPAISSPPTEEAHSDDSNSGLQDLYDRPGPSGTSGQPATQAQSHTNTKPALDAARKTKEPAPVSGKKLKEPAPAAARRTKEPAPAAALKTKEPAQAAARKSKEPVPEGRKSKGPGAGTVMEHQPPLSSRPRLQGMGRSLPPPAAPPPLSSRHCRRTGCTPA